MPQVREADVLTTRELGNLQRKKTNKAGIDHSFKVIAQNFKLGAVFNPVLTKKSVSSLAKLSGLICCEGYVGTKEDFERMLDHWNRTKFARGES